MAGAVDRLNRVLIVIGCIAVGLMMLHISADVAARLLLNAPIDGTLETIEYYYMVMVVFLPFGYVTRGEGQIIVELFTRAMAPRSLARLEVLVGLVTLVFMGLFTWNTADEAVTKTLLGEFREMGDKSYVVWPSRWILPAGCAVMMLAVVLRLGEDIRRAVGAADER